MPVQARACTVGTAARLSEGCVASMEVPGAARKLDKMERDSLAAFSTSIKELKLSEEGDPSEKRPGKLRKDYSGREARFAEEEVVKGQKLRGPSGVNLPASQVVKDIHRLDEISAAEGEAEGEAGEAHDAGETHDAGSGDADSGEETPAPWTQEEDERLVAAVEQYGELWTKVALELPNHSQRQCLQRWKKTLKPSLKQGGARKLGHWSPGEDALLLAAVRNHQVTSVNGKIVWSDVAKSIPQRTCKQCRERWVNHINPDVVKDKWTPEEDKLLLEVELEFPKKWAQIARKIPGRTENMVKVRWKILDRLRNSEGSGGPASGGVTAGIDRAMPPPATPSLAAPLSIQHAPPAHHAQAHHPQAASLSPIQLQQMYNIMHMQRMQQQHQHQFANVYVATMQQQQQQQQPLRQRQPQQPPPPQQQQQHHHHLQQDQQQPQQQSVVQQQETTAEQPRWDAGPDDDEALPNFLDFGEFMAPLSGTDEALTGAGLKSIEDEILSFDLGEFDGLGLSTAIPPPGADAVDAAASYSTSFSSMRRHNSGGAGTIAAASSGSPAERGTHHRSISSSSSGSSSGSPAAAARGGSADGRRGGQHQMRKVNTDPTGYHLPAEFLIYAAPPDCGAADRRSGVLKHSPSAPRGHRGDALDAAGAVGSPVATSLADDINRLYSDP